MKAKNELIYSIRQILGEEKSNGFFLPVIYNDKEIQVPNYLFKDAPAEYPEIRISPFLEDEMESHAVRIRKYNYDNKKRFYTAKFQIDIYATNVAQVNTIYDALERRIDLFYDIDTVIYGYNKTFKQIGEYLYHSNMFVSDHFCFSDIIINGWRIHKVNHYDDMEMNTYIINHDGLYIKTCLPIKLIKMWSIVNGLTFPDGTTAFSRGIIKTNISNKIMLSDLEKNNVERISFELDIFYAMDQIRNPGPLATHTQISDYYGR